MGAIGRRRLVLDEWDLIGRRRTASGWDRPPAPSTPTVQGIAFPNAFFVGAQKAGTKSLAHYVGQHPDVYVPEAREPHYFAYPIGVPSFCWEGRDLLEGRIVSDRVRMQELYEPGADATARCDFSTMYLYVDGVAARIAADAPDARIVMVLRQPAERAYSSYRFMRLMHAEPLPSPRAAFAAETNRIERGYAPLYHYLSVSRYARPVSSFFDTFSRDQILVVLSEELESRPDEVVGRVFEHIGVGPHPVDVARRENVYKTPRSLWVDRQIRRLPRLTRRRVKRVLRGANHAPRELPSRFHQELSRSFADDVAQLSMVVDREMRHWVPPPR